MLILNYKFDIISSKRPLNWRISRSFPIQLGKPKYQYVYFIHICRRQCPFICFWESFTCLYLTFACIHHTCSFSIMHECKFATKMSSKVRHTASTKMNFLTSHRTRFIAFSKSNVFFY